MLCVAAAIVIELSGGGYFAECERSDCGALGEFAMEQTWPLVPLVFLVASLAFAWWRVRRRGRPTK